jgi:predicted RNase H-like HicB family nuclease
MSGQALRDAPMSSTLSVSVEIPARVHPIEGGGYWAEVPSLPGCVAQAETLEALRENIRSAIVDWMAQSAVKTHGEASQLAAIQGAAVPAEENFPQSNEYRPPPSWTDEDG